MIQPASLVFPRRFVIFDNYGWHLSARSLENCRLSVDIKNLNGDLPSIVKLPRYIMERGVKNPVLGSGRGIYFTGAVKTRSSPVFVFGRLKGNNAPTGCHTIALQLSITTANSLGQRMPSDIVTSGRQHRRRSCQLWRNTEMEMKKKKPNWKTVEARDKRQPKSGPNETR